jgi:hypothetical protein
MGTPPPQPMQPELQGNPIMPPQEYHGQAYGQAIPMQTYPQGYGYPSPQASPYPSYAGQPSPQSPQAGYYAPQQAAPVELPTSWQAGPVPGYQELPTQYHQTR